MNVNVNPFWDLDTIGITNTASESDNDAVYRHFEKTLAKDILGRYTVSWPWRNTHKELSNNYAMYVAKLKVR